MSHRDSPSSRFVLWILYPNRSSFAVSFSKFPLILAPPVAFASPPSSSVKTKIQSSELTRHSFSICCRSDFLCLISSPLNFLQLSSHERQSERAADHSSRHTLPLTYRWNLLTVIDALTSCSHTKLQHCLCFLHEMLPLAGNTSALKHPSQTAECNLNTEKHSSVC